MASHKNRPHVVILGAGFGGAYVARGLSHLARRGDAEITVVNSTNYFLFTPLLHEVATGGLSPLSAAEPLREAFRGKDINITPGVVELIDLGKKIVTVSSAIIEYDYLVIATGATTNFYGVRGAEENSYVLKDLSDAYKIRNAIIDRFEAAARSADSAERRKLLSFVVVGGGATGVELAGELADFCFKTMRAYYRKSGLDPREEASICVVQSAPEFLMQTDENLRKKAWQILDGLGVECIMGKSVTEVGAEEITLSDNSKIPASAVFWVAGVKPNLPEIIGEVPEHCGAALLVDKNMHLAGRKDVFAMGDASAYVWHSGNTAKQGAEAGKPLPMLAQVAVREAETVAYNIEAAMRGRPPRTFYYRTQGVLISIGQWQAIGEVFGMHVSGPLAWLLWRATYLVKFHSLSKKIKVAAEWFTNLFFPRDITRLD